MKQLSKQEREKRILARGESKNHIHCITGNVTFNDKGQIIISEDSNAVLRHLLEKDWTENGVETWTGEHKDITLAPGIYEPVLQEVFDPLSKRIERVRE